MGDSPACTSENPVEDFRLRNRPRKAIKHETAARIRLLDPLLDQADNDLVGHQSSARHELGSLSAELGSGLARGTEHVAGGDLRHTKLGAETLCLGALTGAWRTDENYVHGYAALRPWIRGPPGPAKPSRCREIRYDSIWLTVSRATPTTIMIDVPPKGN